MAGLSAGPAIAIGAFVGLVVGILVSIATDGLSDLLQFPRHLKSCLASAIIEGG